MSGATASPGDGVPSLPMDFDYADDVSRVFISLNSRNMGGGGPGGEAPAPTPAPAPPPAGAGGAANNGKRGRQSTAARRQEEENAGALAEYFSSLFDESFCSHNFKLVGYVVSSVVRRPFSLLFQSCAFVVQFFSSI